jgi:RecA/RadA recombinase
MGEDKKEEIIRVNQDWERNGKKVRYDMVTGQYDIVMDSSPSYVSRRQEAEATIGNLIQRLPPMMGAAISDLYVRSMDTPYSMEMADRLKRMVPPEALKKEGDNQIDPAQVQQMGQMLQMLQQQNQQYLQMIEKMQLEIESKNKDRELEIDKAVLSSETTIEATLLKNAKQMDEMKNIQTLLLAQIKKMESSNSTAPAQTAEKIPPDQGVTGE